MEQHGATSPICTIKMKYLRCCAQCPLKVKEKLQKLDGVEDINIDPEQGLLRVQGKIDPMVLTKAVQNMDKKAELWSFQKEPFQNYTGKSSKYFQIGKECSCDGDCDDHGSSSDDESPSSKVVPKKQYGILSWIKKDKTMKNDNNKGISDTGMPMPPPRPRPRPPMGLPMDIPAHKNFYGPPRPIYRPPNPYYQPMVYHRPPPPPYSYYGQMQPPSYSYFRPMLSPKVNPFVHYTSYADNYRYP